MKIHNEKVNSDVRFSSEKEYMKFVLILLEIRIRFLDYTSMKFVLILPEIRNWFLELNFNEQVG